MGNERKNIRYKPGKSGKNPLAGVSFSNPDSWKHLPHNPDLITKRKVLYGEFIKKANNPNLQRTKSE